MFSVAEVPEQIGFKAGFIASVTIGIEPILTANVLVKKLSQLLGGNLNALTFNIVELLRIPVVNVIAEPFPNIDEPVGVMPLPKYN